MELSKSNCCNFSVPEKHKIQFISKAFTAVYITQEKQFKSLLVGRIVSKFTFRIFITYTQVWY